MSQLLHRARTGSGHNRQTTSLPSHPPLNHHHYRNRPRHLLDLKRKTRHHGPAMGRTQVVVSAHKFSNQCRKAGHNRVERRPRLSYPSPRSPSYRPSHRASRQRASSLETSRSKTYWETRLPSSRLGDKDLRHSHPLRHPILSPNLRRQKGGRGRENKSRPCLPWEASRRDFVTIVW